MSKKTKTKLRKNSHSSYYDRGGISLVDIWNAKLTPEEFKGMCKGNALKYIIRAGNKEGNRAAQDISKAIDYLENLKVLLEKEDDNEDC